MNENYRNAYKDGYVDGVAECEPFMFKWIAVKDEFPPNKSVVLAWNKDELQVCQFEKTEWEYFFMLNNTSHQIRGVTHWMKLPEPPR